MQANERAPHDPAVGQWFFSSHARGICCIVGIESVVDGVGPTLAGEIATIVFEDGTVCEEPVSAIRDSGTFYPVDRPDAEIGIGEMDRIIDDLDSQATSDVKTALYQEVSD